MEHIQNPSTPIEHFTNGAATVFQIFGENPLMKKALETLSSGEQEIALRSIMSQYTETLIQYGVDHN